MEKERRPSYRSFSFILQEKRGASWAEIRAFGNGEIAFRSNFVEKADIAAIRPAVSTISSSTAFDWLAAGLRCPSCQG